MCTVTVVPTPRGHRLVCNRDEQRSRAHSTDLVVRRCGEGVAAMPIDPPSGGTWIGANSVGVVACLLNANPGVARCSADRWRGRGSRGVIVPEMLAQQSLCKALSVALELDPRSFPPFRLLLLADGAHAIVVSDGTELRSTAVAATSSPILLTSSGLGDGLVEPHRRGLFQRLLEQHADLGRLQDQFHSHAWSDRPHLSVLVSRPDARTVSRTTIDIATDVIDLHHARLGETLSPAATSTHTLHLTPALQPA